jgi:hypothetical protein
MTLSHDAHRAQQSLARYYFRRAQYLAGRHVPDGRDHELKDRGAAFAWRVRVLRNEQRRAEAARQRRIQAGREDAVRRWHPQPNNVHRIEEAKR